MGIEGSLVGIFQRFVHHEVHDLQHRSVARLNHVDFDEVFLELRNHIRVDVGVPDVEQKENVLRLRIVVLFAEFQIKRDNHSVDQQLG